MWRSDKCHSESMIGRNVIILCMIDYVVVSQHDLAEDLLL